jgi:ABC-type transport system substrate-binding protein
LGAPVTGEDELFFLHKDFSLELTRWQNAEYLRLYDVLRTELDGKKRQDIMNVMHAIVWDECPWLWIYNQVDNYGVSTKLTWEARPDERIVMWEAGWKS